MNNCKPTSAPHCVIVKQLYFSLPYPIYIYLLGLILVLSLDENSDRG